MNNQDKTKSMRDAILEIMSENDAFTYQDEPITMAKQRLEYYHDELLKLYKHNSY